MSQPGTLDKQALYGDFRDWAKKKMRLGMKVAHKALDIAEDDMNITANRRGIGALGATGIALAAGLPSALLAGWMLLNQAKPVTSPSLPSVDRVLEESKDGGKTWNIVPTVRDK